MTTFITHSDNLKMVAPLGIDPNSLPLQGSVITLSTREP
jgi:hypothetical protein